MIVLGLLLLLSCCTRVCAATASESFEDNASVQRFREYLRIPTVQPDPDYAAAIDFLLAQAHEIGLPANTFELVEKKPILIMTWQGLNSSLPSILLNSHMDVVPAEKEKWEHDPFEAFMDESGNIYARGSQDMKVVGMQYLEAIRNLLAQAFAPIRTVHVCFVPDEELGGGDGWAKFINSTQFFDLNVGVVLDEGQVSYNNTYTVNYAEKSPWWLVIKAVGEPGHGSIFYDNTALENLFRSIESITRYRESQFNMVKAGLATSPEVVSINGVFLKAGTPTPTGFTMNIQPSEAEAGFDIRVPPFADVVRSLDRRIAEEWAPASRNMVSWFEYRFESETGEPPVTTADDSNAWWTLLSKAVAKFDAVLVPLICSGATDARFARVKGIPAFGFTPVQNIPSLIHAHNEFMNAGEFLKGIMVYEEVIKLFATHTEEDFLIVKA